MTRVLKNFKKWHFTGVLVTIVYIVWAQKVPRGYLWWQSKFIQSLKENWLTCASKNDMRNLENVQQNLFESRKIRTFMESFHPKMKIYELRIYRGVMCYDNEEWCKIWKGIHLSVQNWHGEFDEFLHEHLKVSKICTLMGCFWPKYIMFELKKNTEELYLMALKIVAKFEGKLSCTF